MALIAWTGPNVDGKRELTGETTIGRASASDIRLADRWVSKRHASIRPEGDGWLFQDEESREHALRLIAALRAEAPDSLRALLDADSLDFTRMQAPPPQPEPLHPPAWSDSQ